jgi:hypothetical protein
MLNSFLYPVEIEWAFLQYDFQLSASLEDGPNLHAAVIVLFVGFMLEQPS